MIKEGLRPASAHDYLSHMAYVKYSCGVANSLVFRSDARVINRHLPATKFDKLAAQFLMGSEKGCSFHHCYRGEIYVQRFGNIVVGGYAVKNLECTGFLELIFLCLNANLGLEIAETFSHRRIIL